MAVIIVSTVTAFNDYQKDKQFRALNKESSRIKIKVIRNGESINVEIDYLLVGVRVITLFSLICYRMLSFLGQEIKYLQMVF
jgi:hypothetical protein